MTVQGKQTINLLKISLKILHIHTYIHIYKLLHTSSVKCSSEHSPLTILDIYIHKRINAFYIYTNNNKELIQLNYFQQF